MTGSMAEQELRIAAAVSYTHLKDAYAMTINLLLNSEGKKMGKTESGAVWLDPEKTSPYEFFQYWRNVADADVIKCLKMLTFLPLEEIVAMESWEGSQLNKAKEILAFELTKLVHGEEEAQKAKEEMCIRDRSKSYRMMHRVYKIKWYTIGKEAG